MPLPPEAPTIVTWLIANVAVQVYDAPLVAPEICTVVVVPNVVDVPESPGRWRFTSLTEVDLATIRRITAATSPAEVL